MIFGARNLVFLLLVAAFVFAEESNKPAEPEAKSEKKATDPQPIPTTSPAPSSSTTGAPVTHPTTTLAPTTTPNATTSTSTTTTTTTTTTPPPTTTSTAKPTPTTPPTTPQPITTTPKPTPTPTPTIDSWTVNGPNGTVCITANMVIRITVPYKSIVNKTVEATFKVDSVQNATASGTCNGVNNTESLVLSWSNVTATFHFTLNVSNHIYSLDSVNVAILVNNATFPNNTMTNMTELQLVYKGALFSIPQNNSYTCTNVAALSLTGANNTIPGKLTVAHVKVQAFGMDKAGKYRAPLDCASIETPDIVPIAVGLVLAGLVVVVLVAYLVGRRRAQARGYLSM